MLQPPRVQSRTDLVGLLRSERVRSYHLNSLLILGDIRDAFALAKETHQGSGVQFVVKLDTHRRPLSDADSNTSAPRNARPGGGRSGRRRNRTTEEWWRPGRRLASLHRRSPSVSGRHVGTETGSARQCAFDPSPYRACALRDLWSRDERTVPDTPMCSSAHREACPSFGASLSGAAPEPHPVQRSSVGSQIVATR
jgi:hypothetical protein